MLASTHGRIDFEEGRFVARFDGESTVVAAFKKIQRCYWRATHSAWVIEPHWPSVNRLIRIASEQQWNISAEAWREKERVQSAGESLEYSLDMIHDNQGRARFRCMVGDDDELRDEIKSLPGAYWEDEYWSVPTDWEHCCPALREIVEGDTLFTVSPAAELLLEEEDVSHLHIRTIAPLREVVAKRRGRLRSSSSVAVEPATYNPANTTRRSLHVAGEDLDEVVLQELSDAVVKAKPVTRKPHVRTSANKRPPAANEDVS